VQDEALAFFHTAFEICAVEKARVEGAGTVAKSGVEYGGAAAPEADGGASSGGYFAENGVNLAGDDFGNFCETDAVFVTEGEIAEQIAGGEKAAFFEDGGAVGADAFDEFDGGC
jgi:hypothetical protein